MDDNLILPKYSVNTLSTNKKLTHVESVTHPLEWGINKQLGLVHNRIGGVGCKYNI